MRGLLRELRAASLHRGGGGSDGGSSGGGLARGEGGLGFASGTAGGHNGCRNDARVGGGSAFAFLFAFAARAMMLKRPTPLTINNLAVSACTCTVTVVPSCGSSASSSVAGTGSSASSSVAGTSEKRDPCPLIAEKNRQCRSHAIRTARAPRPLHMTSNRTISFPSCVNQCGRLVWPPRQRPR